MKEEQTMISLLRNWEATYIYTYKIFINSLKIFFFGISYDKLNINCCAVVNVLWLQSK